MGLFSPDLVLQQLAASSGKFLMPNVSDTSKDKIVGDYFDRETLNPTGFPTIYTTASNDGNGTATMINAQSLRLAPDTSAIGDDVDVRISDLAFSRTTLWNTVDAKSANIFRITFLQVETADTEGFIGLLPSSTTSISALPTTTNHLGVFFDASAQANYLLTSGDGTTQTTTDTTEPLDVNNHGLEIDTRGLDSATIRFFNIASGGAETLIATQTVTAIGQDNFKLHFFAQTEATANARLQIGEWQVNIL